MADKGAVVFNTLGDAIASGIECGNRKLYRVKLYAHEHLDEERIVMAASNMQAVVAMTHDCFGTSVEIVTQREIYSVAADVLSAKNIPV